MSIYIGVNNKARKVKSIYVGVNGIAHKVKKAYIGISNKARLFFTDSPFNINYRLQTDETDVVKLLDYKQEWIDGSLYLYTSTKASEGTDSARAHNKLVITGDIAGRNITVRYKRINSHLGHKDDTDIVFTINNNGTYSFDWYYLTSTTETTVTYTIPENCTTIDMGISMGMLGTTTCEMYIYDVIIDNYQLF